MFGRIFKSTRVVCSLLLLTSCLSLVAKANKINLLGTSANLTSSANAAAHYLSSSASLEEVLERLKTLTKVLPYKKSELTQAITESQPASLLVEKASPVKSKFNSVQIKMTGKKVGLKKSDQVGVSNKALGNKTFGKQAVAGKKSFGQAAQELNKTSAPDDLYLFTAEGHGLYEALNASEENGEELETSLKMAEQIKKF